MSIYRNISKNNKKRTLFAIISLAIIVLGSFFVYRYFQANPETPANAKKKGADMVNLNGPTDEEKKSGDGAKDKIIENEKARNQPNTPTSNGKKLITPTLTYAQQYGQQVEVGAYISSVFEDGGVCKLTFTKDTITQTAQVDAVKGASSVDCPVMVISRSKLEAGSWQASVTYTSSSSEGSSLSRNVEVK
jgi:hypothetical protein